MKYLFKIALLLLLPFIGWTQNREVIITTENFNKENDCYFFGDVSGWIFQQGNDTSWAKKDIDLSVWKSLRPTELSLKYADSTGKVEGWFRVKIKLDSSIGNKLSGVNLGSWAASDLYINGELVTSNGNTGAYGNHFREGNPYKKLSYKANLKAGEVYTIAIHFIDYKSTLPPFQLRSSYFLKNLISVTGPKYDSYVLENIKENSVSISISISVLFILSLLFWILYIQNPTEKNLRLIAYGTTGLTIAFFSIFQIQHASASYNAYKIWILVNAIFSSVTILLVLLIIVNIFKRKVTKALKIFIVVSLIVLLSTNFIPLYLNDILSLSFTALFFIICIYYIVSSWRNLKGSQWAVVAGLLFFLLLLLTLFIVRYFLVSSLGHYFIRILLPTILTLSFPISLLVYVSLRFKELVTEVQQNGNQVLQLSEEKREQALIQQKVLEEEVTRQTGEIRQTLENLKSTQSQLIQSEKMASLGELTAGIAHEIQNPLNFVNNFSEVSNELIDEMNEELLKGDIEEAKLIANDVKLNLEKIVYHGKRADAIVKGMLQHSRSGNDQKEPTDVIKLCDEYLRLAYHGFRAKDKSFNATLKTEFDETIGLVNLSPQNIGRVVLNLITNAFYAVADKAKQIVAGYEPMVKVSTRNLNNQLEIAVSDNGNGIPKEIADKIFQPFFTTKPTGEGTGLGLSLSYDIIKAHGGEIKVVNSEAGGTRFSIYLPKE